MQVCTLTQTLIYIAICELRIASCKLQTTEWKLQTANCKLQANLQSVVSWTRQCNVRAGVVLESFLFFPSSSSNDCNTTCLVVVLAFASKKPFQLNNVDCLYKQLEIIGRFVMMASCHFEKVHSERNEAINKRQSHSHLLCLPI